MYLSPDISHMFRCLLHHPQGGYHFLAQKYAFYNVVVYVVLQNMQYNVM